MSIEIVDFPIENGNVSLLHWYVSLAEGGSSHLVGYNPIYKWIGPTYPTYKWGYNLLMIHQAEGMSIVQSCCFISSCPCAKGPISVGQSHMSQLQ